MNQTERKFLANGEDIQSNLVWQKHLGGGYCESDWRGTSQRGGDFVLDVRQIHAGDSGGILQVPQGRAERSSGGCGAYHRRE